MTRQDAMRRVRALLARAADTDSADEAATAAALAEKLMTKFEIETATINDTEDDINTEPITDYGDKGAPLYVSGGKQMATWRGILAMRLARLYACCIYREYRWNEKKRRSASTLEIIGRPGDVESVRYMFQYLSREIDRLAREQGRGCGRTWCNNFRIGAIRGVICKMQEARRCAYNEARRAATGKCALMRVDQAITKITHRARETERWVATNKKLRRGGRASYRNDFTAAKAGYTAGRSIHTGGGAPLSSGAKRLGPGR